MRLVEFVVRHGKRFRWEVAANERIGLNLLLDHESPGMEASPKRKEAIAT